MHMTLPGGLRMLGLLCALALAVAAEANELPPVPTDAVRPLAPAVVRPFDLADVTLGPEPFREAMERDRAYLLRLDPDRPVTVEAGLSGLTPRSAAGETLTAPRVDSVNTFEAPAAVAPKPISAKVDGSVLTLAFEPKSVTVISVEP
jgi:hypothetical protein